MVDLLTGTVLYVSIPPEQIDGVAPWTAILGALVPVEGVWRTGGAFLPMSPATADRLAEVIVELVDESPGRLWGRGGHPRTTLRGTSSLRGRRDDGQR